MCDLKLERKSSEKVHFHRISPSLSENLTVEFSHFGNYVRLNYLIRL